MTRILSVVDSLDLGFHYLNTYFLRHSVKPMAEQVLQNHFKIVPSEVMTPPTKTNEVIVALIMARHIK